jgi:hypothetical protein
MTRGQRNIFKVYNKANAEQIRQGLSWYNDGHAEAIRLAELLPDKSIARAAGIISAVSPGLRWEQNIEAAERIIRGETLEGIGQRYKAHRDKAIRIRDGSDVEKEFTGRDRPKTRAFWKLLCNPADPLTMCVDGHGYAIWFGERITLDKTPHVRGRLYQRIAGDYIVVAKMLGILPCQLQAITWVTWRHIWEVAPF